MKNKKQYIGQNTSAGFSLVEITLALLVVAVGLLAVFGLLGDSLRANTKTQDDTVAATFAESVFSSVFAADWEDDSYNVLMGEGDFWGDDSSDNIEICDNEDDIKVNKYLYNEIGYYPLRYNLRIVEQKDWRGDPVNDNSPNQNAVWRAFRLKVWIGEFADTSENNTDVYDFYTEQYKFIDPKREYEQNN